MSAQAGTRSVLIVQHEDECPPAWFGEWLSAAGLSLHLVNGHEGEPVPEALTDHDALLVLGGEMGANDDADHAWLAPTKSLITSVVHEGTPFLGICLGHQLAVAALGGEVAKNPNGHARGLTPVALTLAGADDPLLCASDGQPAIQWNGDVAIRLPEGAVRLATSPDGTVQAARFGPLAWGVQFHPEASPAVFRSWTVDKPSARTPGPRTLHAVDAIDAAEDELRAAWEPLARRFAAIVLRDPGLGA